MSPLGSKSAKKKAAAAAPATTPAAAGRGVVVEKPKANIYTVLLILSFVAIVIGCLCLYGEMSVYEFKTKAAL
jgi:hypothetical protein